MNQYNNLTTTGELWLRNVKGDKVLASNALSAIYAKYEGEYKTFYTQLKTDQITRFDTFYDCIFVETPAGCIFEKIIPDGDAFKPFNLLDLHTVKHNSVAEYISFDTYVDYWFDEKNHKIIYANIVALEENRYFKEFFTFVILVNEYDCKTSTRQTIIFDKVTLCYKSARNWDIYNYIFETPKITHNALTNKYNLSFLFKNATKEFGLMSFNFAPGSSLEQGGHVVTEVNGHLPFFDLDLTRCSVQPYDPTLIPPYHVVTVSNRKYLEDGITLDPAYDPNPKRKDHYQFIALSTDVEGLPVRRLVIETPVKPTFQF